MDEKKVVLVSGGSRGLGQAIVEDLYSRGYITVTFSRSKTDFIQKLEGEGEDRFYWEAIDATDIKKLKPFVLNVNKKYGRIDALVNNAGVNLDQLIPMTSEEEISRILALNLESVMNLTRSVSRIMLRQQEGVILNISSILGLRGFKGSSVYSATKAALDGFSRSLARELGAKKIRVNSIAPGFMDTEMTHGMSEERKAQIIRRTPMGRLGKPEDVTGLVSFLLSPKANFITGQTFTIDGGLTC